VERARIVLVEDEDAVARPLVASLAREGFAVERFVSAEDALDAMARARPDLVVLDVMLPGMSGVDACAVVRSRWAVPVLLLTARAEEEDRVVGLDVGADDYVTKPFSSSELAARIRAILRRVAPRSPLPVLEVGALVLDLGRREVRVDGRTVSLTPREFDLLALLVERSPAVVGRDELIAEVWDAHWEGPTKTLDVHVNQIRRKIEPDPHHPRFLHTARGVGYQVRDACVGD
jgi:two-component system, OmpR family, response regulator RegX3